MQILNYKLLSIDIIEEIESVHKAKENDWERNHD